MQLCTDPYGAITRSTSAQSADQATAYADVPEMPHEVERLSNCANELIGRAVSLRCVLHKVSDRMFGKQLETENGSAKGNSRSGDIGSLMDLLDQLATELDYAARQADRLTAL